VDPEIEYCLVMAEETPPLPGTARAGRADRQEGFVTYAVTAGLIVAVIGLADGLAMAFKRHVAECPNGHYFPPGTTNFNCYVYPHAGDGVAIAVFSILLGIVVALAGIAAVAGLRGRSSAIEVDAAERRRAS
jgi:hypothetical protein